MRCLCARYYGPAFQILAAGVVVSFTTCSPSPPVTGSGTATTEEEPVGPPIFQDVTADSGVTFTYRNGEEANHYAIIESLGGGVALIDFDRDGLLDIFIPGGGHYDGKKVVGNPCKLYRNLGNFKFEDVTAQVGLDAVSFPYSHGAAAFDYDCDGWPDLLITGYNRLVLLHNEPDGKGGRRFVDVTRPAKLTDNLWSSTAAWGDLDGDGFPEIYVSHYANWGFDTNHPTDCTYDGKTRDVCQPRRFVPLPHSLFKNNRGVFSDVSATMNLRKDGKGMQALLVDVNNDGKPDIYVANDTDPKFLYVNRGKTGELSLREMGLDAGVDRDGFGQANGSMGLDAADFNRSGLASLFVTNYENELPALYRNLSKDGRTSFVYDSLATGIGTVGGGYVSWGTGFLDYDHDGWEDLLIVSGHAIRYPTKIDRRQKPVLLENRQGKFKAVSKQGGSYFQQPHNARGAAFGDLDNDGKIDVVISHLNEPVVILRNVAETTGRHWVGIELQGKNNRDLVGTRIVLESANGKQTKFIKGGGSFASTNDSRLVFGLGPDTKIDKATVYWSWGQSQEITGLAPEAYWQVVEGETTARKPAWERKMNGVK